MDGETSCGPQRRRLPNRRKAETRELAIGGGPLKATVGFAAGGRPAEICLAGAKDGSGLAAILDDASVVISIALQYGIPAGTLAKSIARLPTSPLAPPHVTRPLMPIPAVSVIGAALDFCRTRGALQSKADL
jgi:ribonucleoside-diphosphate reductase alpha chain